MVRLSECFECLQEAGVKMGVAKRGSMNSAIKHLGRVVSAESVNLILKLSQNYEFGKFPATKRKCKAFWALPTIIESSSVGMTNSLLLCTPLLV